MAEPKKKSRSEPNPGAIVVTGTSGFKGSRIIKALEADNRYPSIVAIDARKPPPDTRKTRFYKLDLTETLADVKLAEILKNERCDTLVHCAFPITPPKNPSFAHELISIGTLYVITACAEARVRKVILASTTDVYGAFPTNPNFLQEDVHPPKGDRQSAFLADKIDAEKQGLKFAAKYPDRVVTILRACTILGPTIQSYKTNYLRRPFVTTIMGFDPLVQFIHEDDLIRSFMRTIEKDCPGIYNIVGDGVLPLSRVIKICGKMNLRLPQMGFKTMVQLMWMADISPAPASHVNFLRYLCIADGAKAKKDLGFVPQFSTKEALLSFVGAERLREVRLIEA
ncbi:MAG: NAD-dependent epimerase/dehydratase family protein [Deltaproteobacteria bacterium]|nr:NAD-dependent epimerase/dehydratase family protein [Deltaproteobacteria bacterium]